MTCQNSGMDFCAEDDELRNILSQYRKIAIVGLSADESRDSNKVARFLKERGFNIIPVNPNHTEVLGQRCYPSLAEICDEIEIVDIFRRSDSVDEIVDRAIAAKARVIWMQEGVKNHAAAARAQKAGLAVVMDRCIKREYSRLFPS